MHSAWCQNTASKCIAQVVIIPYHSALHQVLLYCITLHYTAAIKLHHNALHQWISFSISMYYCIWIYCVPMHTTSYKYTPSQCNTPVAIIHQPLHGPSGNFTSSQYITAAAIKIDCNALHLLLWQCNRSTDILNMMYIHIHEVNVHSIYKLFYLFSRYYGSTSLLVILHRH